MFNKKIKKSVLIFTCCSFLSTAATPSAVVLAAETQSIAEDNSGQTEEPMATIDISAEIKKFEDFAAGKGFDDYMYGRS